jgi:hypothetical protein
MRASLSLRLPLFSPAAPSAVTTSSPRAELEELAASASGYVTDERARATRRAFGGDFQAFRDRVQAGRRGARFSDEQTSGGA